MKGTVTANTKSHWWLYFVKIKIQDLRGLFAICARTVQAPFEFAVQSSESQQFKKRD